jgi:hypothetical protein
MDAALKTVVDLVEGRIDAAQFQRRFLEDPDGFERLLDDDPNLRPDNWVGSSVFQHVLNLDLTSAWERNELQDALTEWLARRGVEHTPADSFGVMVSLVLETQPKWADGSMDRELLAALQRDAGDRTGGALQTWVRGRLKELFRYASQPPEWIQSPEWPIRDGRPLVFLEQLAVEGYFHDEAAAYVFHDPETGECETLLQVA